MKKLLLLSFAAACLQVNSQATKTVSAQEYDQLKQTNKLEKGVKYIYSQDPINLNAAKVIHPIINEIDTVGGSSACSCIVPLDGSFSVVPMAGGTAPNYRNDDGSSANIPLNFPFCYYGTTYNSCYINNNGNITFESSTGSFSAGGFPAGNAGNTDTIMIAPFWGDVDTRGAASGLVYFKQTANALIIKWESVGYYSSKTDKLNTFQLIISDGSDTLIPDGKNVAFCYGDMQWTTGGASGSQNGFGGIPATAGANRGDGINYAQIGRFDASLFSYDGPNLLADGVDWLDNKSVYFNTCGTNLLAIADDSICDTLVPIFDSLGNPYRLFLNSMDVNDQITYTIVKQPVGSFIIPVDLGNATLLSMTYYPVALGQDTLLVEFSDDSNPGVNEQFMRIFDVQAFSSAVGIKSQTSLRGISVYPNPATDEIFIKTVEGQKLNSVQLIDVFGEIVYKSTGISENPAIKLGNPASGIYTVLVTDASGKVSAQKLIIR